MDEKERCKRVARLIAEIKSLKIGAAGDDSDNVRRLRSDKIAALAERFSYPGELPENYNLINIIRRIDEIVVQHSADLLNSPDRVRGERIASAPSDEALSSMTATERLAHANRIAHLVANAKKSGGTE